MTKKPAVKPKMVFILAVTGLFFLINLALVLTHEPYFNEANQWQIARQASPAELPDILKTEGHPILYYLLLMPLAKLGLPMIAANILSLLIMTLAVFLFVKYAPFKKYAIVLTVFSVGFMYYLPVFARNYCLAALGVVLVGATYRDRLRHPVRYCLSLALLLQSHILAAGLVSVLFVIFCVEYMVNLRKKTPKLPAKKVYIAAAVIVLASLAVLVGCLWGSTEAHGYLKPNLPEAVAPSSSIFGYFDALGRTLFGIGGIGVLVAVIFVVFGVYFLVRYPKIFFVWMAATLFQAFVLIHLYAFGRFTQDALNILYLALCVWLTFCEKPRRAQLRQRKTKRVDSRIKSAIAGSEILKIIKRIVKPSRDIALGCVCVLTMPSVFAASVHDLSGEYSQSLRIARYINENLPQGSAIVTAAEHESVVSIVPFLRDDIVVYDVVQGNVLDYIIYDANCARDPSVAETMAAIEARGAGNTYFIAASWYPNGANYRKNTAELVKELELVRSFDNADVGVEHVDLSLEQHWGLYKKGF